MFETPILVLAAVLLTGIPNSQGWFLGNNKNPWSPRPRPPARKAPNPWGGQSSTNQRQWGSAPGQSAWGAGGQPSNQGGQAAANNPAPNPWAQPNNGGWPQNQQQNQQSSNQPQPNQNKPWAPKPDPRPATQTSWGARSPSNKPSSGIKSASSNGWPLPKSNTGASAPPVPGAGFPLMPKADPPDHLVNSYWPPVQAYPGASGMSYPDPPDLADVPNWGAPAPRANRWGRPNSRRPYQPPNSGYQPPANPFGGTLQESMFANQTSKPCTFNARYRRWCAFNGDGNRMFRLMDVFELVPKLERPPSCFRNMARAQCGTMDNVMTLYQLDFCRCKNFPFAECILNDCGSSCSFEFYQNNRRVVCE